MSGYDHLIGMELANCAWSWDSDRALLYAVGVGAGLQDPLAELQFSTENAPGAPQQVLPTFLTLMGTREPHWSEPLGWRVAGAPMIGVVHGEQSATLARPIPPVGTAHLSRVLRGVYDKGSAALVVMDTMITLAGSGEPLGSTRMTLFARGKGGFGGPRGPEDQAPWDLPERAPDITVPLPVGLNQSLIYRLSGDHNLHGTDPAKARADGFERPVYYGLGTYGVAGRALLMALCDGDVGRFGHIEARFSKPVHPGDRLDTLIWHTPDGAQFQTLANGDRVVLDRGRFRFGDRSPATGS